MCSSGMVMAMCGVLTQCSTPDIEDIMTGLQVNKLIVRLIYKIQLIDQGNLCRCTGYRPIVEAFEKFTDKQAKIEMNLVSDEVLDQMKSLKNASVMIDNNWLRPASVNDVLDSMKQFPKYFIRQGGTGGYKKFQRQDHDVVIDISAVDELKNISVEEDCLTIGSGATFTNIIKYLKTLNTTDSIITELLRVITNLASPQVSFMLTDGGEATLTVNTATGGVYGSVKPLTGDVHYYLEASGSSGSVLYQRPSNYFNQFED